MRMVALVAVLGVAFVTGADAKRTLPSDLVEVEVKDVLTVSPSHANVVLLKVKGEGILLPIWIGSSEALAISLRLSRQSPPRPLTHDLIDRMLTTLGAKVSKVHIEDLRESVFLGRIYLKHARGQTEIDARPSDSIALAVGARVPILVTRRVLDRAGVNEGEFRVKFAPTSPPVPDAKPRTEGSL